MPLTRVTATGTVRAAPCRAVMYILTPAAAAATLVIRDNGAAGTVKVSLSAGANGPSIIVPVPGGEGFATDCHATITGAGAEAYVAL